MPRMPIGDKDISSIKEEFFNFPLNDFSDKSNYIDYKHYESLNHVLSFFCVRTEKFFRYFVIHL